MTVAYARRDREEGRVEPGRRIVPIETLTAARRSPRTTTRRGAGGRWVHRRLARRDPRGDARDQGRRRAHDLQLARRRAQRQGPQGGATPLVAVPRRDSDHRGRDLPLRLRVLGRRRQCHDRHAPSAVRSREQQRRSGVRQPLGVALGIFMVGEMLSRSCRSSGIFGLPRRCCCGRCGTRAARPSTTSSRAPWSCPPEGSLSGPPLPSVGLHRPDLPRRAGVRFAGWRLAPCRRADRRALGDDDQLRAQSGSYFFAIGAARRPGRCASRYWLVVSSRCTAIAYDALCLAKLEGQTPGMRAVQIRCMPVAGRGGISMPQALTRSVDRSRPA